MNINGVTGYNAEEDKGNHKARRTSGSRRTALSIKSHGNI